MGLSVGEIVLLLIEGIIVRTPRKLPHVMRTAGQWVARLRRMTERDIERVGNFWTPKLSSPGVSTSFPASEKLGGALFCDCRHATVFVYHNGAESYYAGRAFRGSRRVVSQTVAAA